MLKQSNTNITFQIQRIYVKDVSFEAPNTPEIFQQEWNSEIELNLDITCKKLTMDVYEVILQVKVTSIIKDNIAFLCEVQQAGIFTISGINSNKLNYFLCVYCPDILFPYAREHITNQVSRGTFPPLNLAPVNFDAIFTKYMCKKNFNKDN